jgi:hypothetical protein
LVPESHCHMKSWARGFIPKWNQKISDRGHLFLSQWVQGLQMGIPSLGNGHPRGWVRSGVARQPVPTCRSWYQRSEREIHVHERH